MTTDIWQAYEAMAAKRRARAEQMRRDILETGGDNIPAYLDAAYNEAKARADGNADEGEGGPGVRPASGEAADSQGRADVGGYSEGAGI